MHSIGSFSSPTSRERYLEDLAYQASAPHLVNQKGYIARTIFAFGQREYQRSAVPIEPGPQDVDIGRYLCQGWILEVALVPGGVVHCPEAIGHVQTCVAEENVARDWFQQGEVAISVVRPISQGTGQKGVMTTK